MKKYFFTLALLFPVYFLLGQQHNASHEYTWPNDSLVVKKLRHWQDIKFGLMMHWGTYSQWGVVESWSICPEDEGWTKRTGPYASNYFDYVKAYENLQITFNPIRFKPEKWAAAAKEAGMKYLVFTTKHHDGFCMFDSKETDYKVTSSKTAFSSNPRSNITKEIFNAFRSDGFMIGAYFSKPDWHSNDYWWRYFPPKSRNPSYDPARYPAKWNQFKNFTHNQISELMTDYGKIDILWLDGGWVRPQSTIDTTVDWQRSIPYDQDIDMAAIAKASRKKQPGLLMVDRTVSGPYENYVTPEQQVPDTFLPYPWESCITMGNSWSYTPNDQFKSANKIIHLLTDIVSKGGNLLLNIAPGPDGEWLPEAYVRLKQIGAWMKINGEAIYETRGDNIIGKQERFVFTHKNKTVYAIYQVDENTTTIPSQLEIINFKPHKNAKISLLGSRGNLKWRFTDNKVTITIPSRLANRPPCKDAWVFKIN